MGSHRVGHDWSDLACMLEKEMATHCNVFAWRILGTQEPGGLLSMGLHRVRYDWSDLAVAAVAWERQYEQTVVGRGGEETHTHTHTCRVTSWCSKTCDGGDRAVMYQKGQLYQSLRSSDVLSVSKFSVENPVYKYYIVTFMYSTKHQ